MGLYRPICRLLTLKPIFYENLSIYSWQLWFLFSIFAAPNEYQTLKNDRQQQDNRLRSQGVWSTSKEILPDTGSEKRPRTDCQVNRGSRPVSLVAQNQSRHPRGGHTRNGNLHRGQPSVHDCRDTRRLRLGHSHGQAGHTAPTGRVGSLHGYIPGLQSRLHIRPEMDTDGTHIPSVRIRDTLLQLLIIKMAYLYGLQ